MPPRKRAAKTPLPESGSQHFVAIRHLPCGTEQKPPRYVLDALGTNTWDGGLNCKRCQTYRPRDEFEAVPA